MQGSTLTPRGSGLGSGSLLRRGLCLVIKLQDGEVGTRMGSGHSKGSSHWEPWCCHGRPAYFNSFSYLFKEDLGLLLDKAPARCTLGMVALGAQVGTLQLPTWHRPCCEGFADSAWSRCVFAAAELAQWKHFCSEVK